MTIRMGSCCSRGGPWTGPNSCGHCTPYVPTWCGVAGIERDRAAAKEAAKGLWNDRSIIYPGAGNRNVSKSKALEGGLQEGGLTL